MSFPERTEQLFKELTNSDPNEFPRIGVKVSVTDKHGVYIIYNKKDEVLHVGKTNRGKNGLNQRLQNHLYNNSSFTINYKGSDASKLRDECYFRYIDEKDETLRSYLEALAIGKLCPKHIGTGGKKK